MPVVHEGVQSSAKLEYNLSTSVPDTKPLPAGG